MVGPTDVVQPWMPRAARDSDAWLCHVSIVGGARRRGCAAAGAPEFLSGPYPRESGLTNQIPRISEASKPGNTQTTHPFHR